MINIIITTHGEMAQGLKDSIRMLSGEHENVYYISFNEEKGIDDLRDKFKEVIIEVHNDNQWLILCDILGGSPFKIASEFSYNNENVAVYYGVNLPLSIQALLSRENCTLNELKNILNDSLSEMIGLSAI